MSVISTTKVSSTPLSLPHLRFLECEQQWIGVGKIRGADANDGGYKIDRSLSDMASSSVLSVDVIKQIGRIIRKKKKVVEVLDSGCGEAVTLREIKRTFNGMVRTTGITLNSDHVNSILADQSGPVIDELIVGPVESHKFKNEYDFILDFFGPTFYFGLDYSPDCPITTTYGRILAPGGRAFIKSKMSDITAAEKTVRRRFEANKLKILASNSDVFGITDFLIRSTK